jgi:hypothetical protein
MLGLYFIVIYVGYIWLAIWSAQKLGRIVALHKGVPGGLIAAAGVLTILALIPTWDEIATLPKYHNLCQKNAAIEFYGKMSLPDNFYSKNGEPLFITEHGGLDGFLTSTRHVTKPGFGDKTDLYKYIMRINSTAYINAPARIQKSKTCLVDRNNDKKLMCYTTIFWRGGWFRHYIMGDLAGSEGIIHPRQMYCGPDVDFRKIYTKLFYPESSKNK